MEIRRQKKQKEIQDTLLSEAILIEHSKQLAEHERAEHMQKRLQKKQMQQRLYEENAYLLEKKARDKAEREERERAYLRSLDAKFQADEKKRASEVQRLAAKNSSDRPAFQIAAKVHEEAVRSREELYGGLLKKENSLAKQLKESDDAAKARQHATQERMRREFLSQTDKAAIAKREKEQETKRISDMMAAQLKAHQEAEAAKRKARIEASKQYQNALDNQLNELRQRSLHSLQETMTEKERKMNGELIRKCMSSGVFD